MNDWFIAFSKAFVNFYTSTVNQALPLLVPVSKENYASWASNCFLM